MSSPRSPVRPEDVALEHVELAIGARLVDEVSRCPRPDDVLRTRSVRTTLVDELRDHSAGAAAPAASRRLSRRAAGRRRPSSHTTSPRPQRRASPTRRSSTRCVPPTEANRIRLAYEEVVRFYDLALEALDAGGADDRTEAVLAHPSVAMPEAPGRSHGSGPCRRGGGRRGVRGRVGDPGARRACRRCVPRTSWAIGPAPHDPVAVELMREGTGWDRRRRPRSSRVHHRCTRQRARPGARGRGAGRSPSGSEQLRPWCRRRRSAVLRARRHGRGRLRSGEGRSAEVCRVASVGARARRALRARPDWVFEPAATCFGEGLLEAGELDGGRSRVRAGRSASRPCSSGWAPVAFAAARAYRRRASRRGR